MDFIALKAAPCCIHVMDLLFVVTESRETVGRSWTTFSDHCPNPSPQSIPIHGNDRFPLQGLSGSTPVWSTIWTGDTLDASTALNIDRSPLYPTSISADYQWFNPCRSALVMWPSSDRHAYNSIWFVQPWDQFFLR
jgi:hypothetical protein